MHKEKLIQIWQAFRNVRPWHFGVLFLISTAICIVALRDNNLTMSKLRSAVYAADKSGTNVGQALEKLQFYVTSHMNTDLSSGPNAPYPPIQLKYTYERLLSAQEQTQVQQLQQTNNQLYTQAENYCQQQDPTDFSGHNRVPCVEQYVQSHGTSVNLNTETIPASLYEFDFVSPTWSPDLAGWTLVLSIILLLLFILNWGTERWLRRRD